MSTFPSAFTVAFSCSFTCTFTVPIRTRRAGHWLTQSVAIIPSVVKINQYTINTVVDCSGILRTSVAWPIAPPLRLARGARWRRRRSLKNEAFCFNFPWQSGLEIAFHWPGVIAVIDTGKNKNKNEEKISCNLRQRREALHLVFRPFRPQVDDKSLSYFVMFT